MRNIFLCLVMLSHYGVAQVTEENVVEVSPEKVRFDSVKIDNSLGPVRVIGHDKPIIEIRAKKNAPDRRALSRLRVGVTPSESGHVWIRTRISKDDTPTSRKRSSPGRVGVELTLYVPHKLPVEVDAVSGHIVVQKLTSTVKARGHQGRIEVSDCACSVFVEQGTGEQTIAKISGDVDAFLLQGKLQLRDIRGQRLSALVRNGEILGRGLHSLQARLRVVNGDIDAQWFSQQAGTLEAIALSGDVKIRMNKAAQLVIVALKEQVDDQLRATAAEQASGTPRATLRSKEGTVQVVRARF